MTGTFAMTIFVVLSSTVLIGPIFLLVKNRVSVGTRFMGSAPPGDVRGAGDSVPARLQNGWG